MQELKKLKQVKKLGIRCVQSAQGNALCAAIGEMNFLESLNITAKAEEEILDLDFVSAPRYLRVINIKARLTRFPDWIPELEYLVKLMLGFSNFEHDPLDSLRKLPHLSRLNLWDDAFSGDSLHFKVGGFPKLKELDLTRLNKLSSISIDREALLALEHFRCHDNPQLKVLPKDLQNLENLKYLEFADMPAELVDSIDPNKDGPCHRIINHIPRVQVREKVESSFPKYELRPIPTQLNI
ncbi:disease resistance protein (CC-NBS-LRR class) family protein [Trifolium medium]|nr:disease resistance protein (CC-NBS-LRR class) family protein [Trifolium medium]